MRGKIGWRCCRRCPETLVRSSFSGFVPRSRTNEQRFYEPSSARHLLRGPRLCRWLSTGPNCTCRGETAFSKLLKFQLAKRAVDFCRNLKKRLEDLKLSEDRWTYHVGMIHLFCVLLTVLTELAQYKGLSGASTGIPLGVTVSVDILFVLLYWGVRPLYNDFALVQIKHKKLFAFYLLYKQTTWFLFWLNLKSKIICDLAVKCNVISEHYSFCMQSFEACSNWEWASFLWSIFFVAFVNFLWISIISTLAFVMHGLWWAHLGTFLKVDLCFNHLENYIIKRF